MTEGHVRWRSGGNEFRLPDAQERVLNTHAGLLRQYPAVMASLPSFTLGTANASSTISGSIIWAPDNTAAFSYGGLGMVSDTVTAGQGYPGALTAGYLFSRDVFHPSGFHAMFDTDASVLEVGIRSVGNATACAYRVWVNGQPHASTMTALSGLTSSAFHWHKIDFGYHGPKSVIVEYTNCNNFAFSITAADTFWPYSIPKGPKTVVIGDSFTEGYPLNAYWDSWAMELGRRMGWDTFISAVFGTGYLVGGVSTYRNRFANVTDLNEYVRPIDQVIFTGGYNDRNESVEDIQTEAALLYDRCATDLPNARRLLILPFTQGPIVGPGVFPTLRDALKDVADDRGMTSIDPVGYPDATSWFSGNTTVNIGDDELHPTLAGQRLLASRAVQGFAETLA